MVKIMDRRQRKTRDAIFAALTELLSEKNFSQITVGEIISKADIGRATFYAHFETKDFLLKELCEELFCHVFDSMTDDFEGHRHIFNCDAPDSAFLHLFLHLRKNDNNILKLLSCDDNEIFLGYFKSGLIKLIEKDNEVYEPKGLPRGYWVNHIASVFVETVRWWVDNNMNESPEIITNYFLIAINSKRAAE